jgi:hypothetical protein
MHLPKYSMVVIEFDSPESKKHFLEHATIHKSQSISEVARNLYTSTYIINQSLKGDKISFLENYIIEKCEITKRKTSYKAVDGTRAANRELDDENLIVEFS